MRAMHASIAAWRGTDGATMVGRSSTGDSLATVTFDARGGLTSEVLADLRAAHRVVVALKDRNNAVVGYWIRKPHPDQEEAEEFRLLILRAEASPTHGHAVSQEQPLSIEIAQADLLWQEALKHLRPGDVPTIHWALGWAAVLLDPVARTLTTRTGASGTGDYRKRTVPLVTREALPGAHHMPNFVPSYFLGHTNNKRRWRVGQQPAWTFRSPPV